MKVSEKNIYHDALPQDVGVSIHTGFPNPAIDASLKDLDLNQLLVHHPVATYLMRITGDDWRSLGILDNDIVIVDRAFSAQRNDLVAWWEHDTFTLGYAHQLPKNTAHWGVVTATIHQFK